jgi:hypothetical protein
MTSVMSSDQRKLLQQAAKKEAETLERDTAKPPPSAEAESVATEVVIPKAPAAPRVDVVARKSEKPTSSPSPTTSVSAPASRGWPTWYLVAFALLAAAIVVAVRV